MAGTASPSVDRDLVGRVQTGDTGAFEQIIERHAALVYTIARSRLDSHESAEDLAQEVFLRAHLNLRRLTRPDRLAPWLASLARNLAIDWLRRGRQRSQLVPLVPLGEEACRVTDLSAQGARDAMIADEQGRALRRTVEQLPAEQREMVLLHYGEGLTQTEIALRFGVRQNRVHRQLRRALATLRHLLESDVGEADLHKATPALRMPRTVVNRTAALIAAAAVMSTAAKATLAAAAAATQPAVGAGALGLLNAAAAKLAAGGLVMKLTKGAAVVAMAIVGVVSYQHGQSEEKMPSGAAGASQPEALLLRPTSAPGTEWTYTMSGEGTQLVSSPLQGVMRYEGAVETSGSERLTGHLTNGGARWEVRESSRRITRLALNGEPQELEEANANAAPLPSDHFEYECDVTGCVLSSDYGIDGALPADVVVHQIGLHLLSGYPERPVRVGDTWSLEVALPGFEGEMASCTSRLTGLEASGGERVAVIERRAEIDVDTPIRVSIPEIPGECELLAIIGTMSAVERFAVEDGRPLQFDLQSELRLPLRTTSQMPEGPLQSTLDCWKQMSATLVYHHSD